MAEGPTTATRDAAIARITGGTAAPTGEPKAKMASYVERGTTGKERRFGQNRSFGPGAMQPYPGGRDWQRYERPTRGGKSENRYPGKPNYYGGSRPHSIPSVRGGYPRYNLNRPTPV